MKIVQDSVVQMKKKKKMQLENSGIYVAVVEWQMSTRKNQDDIFAVARQLEMRSQSMFGREHGHALYFFLLEISISRELRWEKPYIRRKSNSSSTQVFLFLYIEVSNQVLIL